jgi:DNA polymerase-3 subunit delta'
MSFSKESAFERLSEAHRAGRLAHAYLIAGPTGSGKDWLACQLAAMVLLCTPEEVASHPDAHFVQPESKSRRIVIDQIRELEQSMQRKPLLGSAKVAVIREADRLQPQAANAFLKTLEEPPPGSLILLLSSLPEAMLETILSRCVETSLLDLRPRQPGEEEATVYRALDECLVRPAQPGAADAFRFTRAIQGLLSDLREKISSENDEELKRQSAHYKQTSDSASWLSDRAEQVKALTEATVLRERDRVLQIVFDALGQALRLQTGPADTHATVRAIADKFTSPNLLRRIDALEKLRRRLAMGVQEALALESGFLEMILLREEGGA